MAYFMKIKTADLTEKQKHEVALHLLFEFDAVAYVELKKEIFKIEEIYEQEDVGVYSFLLETIWNDDVGFGATVEHLAALGISSECGEE